MSNLKTINRYLCKVPSPLAGLALAIASLGLSWESIMKTNGSAQLAGSILASVILIPLFLKFLVNPSLLKQDLQHPVAGSVIPTLTMATMVVASTIGLYNLQIGKAVSWFAIILQLFFLIAFIFYRSKSFNFKQILPSWFIPPIGLTLAIVTHPTGLPTILNNIFLVLGLVSYLVLLPIVLYRLFFSGALDNNQKPIIAILATPASLLIVAYLAAVTETNLLLFNVLLFIAIIMTLYVYIAFINLLKLPFSPVYSAFTFPLVVGAIALFKSREVLLKEGIETHWISLITQLANIELIVATLMVIYVTFRYLKHFLSAKS
jgi:tellurite resistance protein TehA-like permease